MNIEVRPNKKRFPVVFVLSFSIAVIVAIVTIDRLLNQESTPAYYYYYYLPFCIILFIYSSLLAVVSLLDYIKTAFDKKAKLIITDTGIDDNLSFCSGSKISWPEIKKVNIDNGMKRNVLLIEVTDPKKIIDQQFYLKRKFLRFFLRRWNTPIVIPENRIAFNIHELKRLLLEHQNK
jgi:hypothetical protein